MFPQLVLWCPGGLSRVCPLPSPCAKDRHQQTSVGTNRLKYRLCEKRIHTKGIFFCGTASGSLPDSSLAEAALSSADCADIWFASSTYDSNWVLKCCCCLSLNPTETVIKQSSEVHGQTRELLGYSRFVFTHHTHTPTGLVSGVSLRCGLYWKRKSQRRAHPPHVSTVHFLVYVHLTPRRTDDRLALLTLLILLQPLKLWTPTSQTGRC